MAIYLSTNADPPSTQASHPHALCLQDNVSDLDKSLWFASHLFSFWVSLETGSSIGHLFPNGNFRVTVLLKPRITLSSYYKIIELTASGFEGICASTCMLGDSLAFISFLVWPWFSLLLPGNMKGQISASISRMGRNFLVWWFSKIKLWNTPKFCTADQCLK